LRESRANVSNNWEYIPYFIAFNLMNTVSKRFHFRKFSVLSKAGTLFLFGLFSFLLMPSAFALSDITVASTKILDSDTIEITFVDAGHNLSSCVFGEIFIDVGGGGSTPITATACAVTDAAAWKITADFAATPFTDTASAYIAAEGLYLDALAVTDSNGDTNLPVAEGDSTAIADGQAPTLTSVNFTGDSEITAIFSEAVTAVAGDFTNLETAGGSADLTINGAVVGSTTTTIVITLNQALGDTSLNAGQIDIAATVVDTSLATNAYAGVADQAVTDG